MGIIYIALSQLKTHRFFLFLNTSQIPRKNKEKKNSGIAHTVKKIYRIPVFFFYQTFQKRENPYADKGFFGALQRRNFLSFEEGKVFLFLQG